MDRREVPREGVLARVRHKYTVTSRIIAPISDVERAMDDPPIANKKTNREKLRAEHKTGANRLAVPSP
jgi:hypothetical protein